MYIYTLYAHCKKTKQKNTTHLKKLIEQCVALVSFSCKSRLEQFSNLLQVLHQPSPNPYKKLH